MHEYHVICQISLLDNSPKLASEHAQISVTVHSFIMENGPKTPFEPIEAQVVVWGDCGGNCLNQWEVVGAQYLKL